MTAYDPFAALGLRPSGQYTNQQVHDAWIAIATATHPDRTDGGNPERYAQASAARETLKTRFGRTETLADMQADALRTAPGRAGTLAGIRDDGPPPPAAAATPAMILHAVSVFPARLRHGRPRWTAARAIIAAAIAWGAVTFAAGTPAAPAAVCGCVLWFLLTTRSDLAAPPGR